MKQFDISKNFVVYNKDILLKTEESSILESVENIITTEIGSIVGNSQLGSNTKQLLFKQNTTFVIFNFIKNLEIKIKSVEPRINRVNIEAKTNVDELETLELKFLLYTDNQTIQLDKTIKGC